VVCLVTFVVDVGFNTLKMNQLRKTFRAVIFASLLALVRKASELFFFKLLYSVGDSNYH